MTSRRERILVVDDDVEFQRSLSKILRKAGYDVRCASESAQAGRLIAQQFFPLVLLDIHLPGRSGLELLDDIRTKWPRAKVIVVTVNGDSSNYVRALEAGAFAFLTKPVKMKQVLQYSQLALKTARN
ncbi:response regulator [Candidatus Parcubacteria bacterium]|nr:MAG: response regulator [Candidatus Parcubacteria bacterium]